MVEDDTFTYHVKPQPRDYIGATAHSLITKERMQKLDLLVHLLSNLPQALVVCGPEGIGKTTLLKVLQERKSELLQYCFMQGNGDLSFEAILQQLAEALGSNFGQSLSMALKQYEGQHKQIVLVIDNAGELVPGLIAAIIQYAAANPALRVVLALTHDELQVKRGSDRAVDDCHVVEIPPLSEKQCGDFLRDLSAKPNSSLSFLAIGDNMIAHIYRETHGVPGRIIAEVSGLSGAKQDGKLKWKLALAAVAAIGIAIAVHWLTSLPKAPGVVPPPESSVSVQQPTIASDLTSTDTGNVVRLPGAEVVVQSPKDNDKAATASPSVEQKASASALPSADIQPQERSVPAPTLPEVHAPNVAKEPVLSVAEVPTDAVKNMVTPSVEADVRKDDRQPASLIAIPEAASMNDSKPLPEKSEVKVQPEPVSVVEVAQKPDAKQAAVAQQEIVSPLSAQKEEPKQPELSKTVKPPIPEKSEVKVQPEPVKALLVEQKQDNKASVAVQQKTAERLWARQEELKKAELSEKTVSSEPNASTNLETIQIPQKPSEIAAVTNGPVIETVVPQQVEPSPIGSQPIAALPSSLGVERTLAQSANNFTLQLIVLSTQSSVSNVLKKYPAMEPDIRVTKTLVKGKEKFVLEYGSYSDADSANKARQSLPFEFHNALVRKTVR